MVQVYCKNTNSTKKFPEGTSLVQMLSEFDFERPYPIVSAKVNNVSQGLKFKVYQNKDIEFIDVRESSGMRVYYFVFCCTRPRRMSFPAASCTWSIPSPTATSAT